MGRHELVFGRKVVGFGPPYSNLGRPRKIWAEFVSIWAGGGIQYGQHECEARWWEFRQNLFRFYCRGSEGDLKR